MAEGDISTPAAGDNWYRDGRLVGEIHEAKEFLTHIHRYLESAIGRREVEGILEGLVLPFPPGRVENARGLSMAILKFGKGGGQEFR
jgi:hypothetical protein